MSRYFYFWRAVYIDGSKSRTSGPFASPRGRDQSKHMWFKKVKPENFERFEDCEYDQPAKSAPVKKSKL